MRGVGFGRLAVRAVIGIAFLGAAWFVGGSAVSMAILGAEARGTVVDYWERETVLPTDDGQKVREPTVELEGGRDLKRCRVIYRGFRYKRELPTYGERIAVVFRPHTHQECMARSTVYSPLRLGLAAGFALVGIVLGGALVTELMV